jgi:hypothetical protein
MIPHKSVSIPIQEFETFLVASEFSCNHWPSAPQTSSEYGFFGLLFEYKIFSGESEPQTTAERSRW